MQKHLRIALASAAAAALTGGLLSLSTGVVSAADSVHHPMADFNGDHIGDVAFSMRLGDRRRQEGQPAR